MLNWILALIALTAAIYTALFWGLRSFFDALLRRQFIELCLRRGVALTHQPPSKFEFPEKTL
jgi:hypothetical protein